MLRVRINSHEAEVSPNSLAQMVLDGKAGRHCLTKSSDGTAERPLEYALEPPHLEALTGELLGRLRSMYASGGSTDDIDDLRDRVETLCQWHWAAPGPRARFLWVAAWLNELTGRFDAAVNHYDAFLQVRCREPHLRLLAYNNRGVLRLRLGRLEGVQDLARAAIAPDRALARLRRSEGLPAACFNLLNLINAAVHVEGLTEVVDEALSEFFARMPEDLAQLWLGSESVDLTDQGGPLSEASPDSQPPLGEDEDESWAEASILCNPTHRRLNRLTSNLAAEAVQLTLGAAVESSDRPEGKVCHLLLWSDGAESDMLQETPSGELDRCAEAASLLLGSEIPSSLVRCKSSGSQAEQLAMEELTEIENLAAAGNHELARARLEVQRRVLMALNHREHLAGLLERIDTQLRWIARSEKESEQLELQRLCGRLISEIEQFCRFRSLSQAERKIGLIRQRLQRYRTEVSAQRRQEVMGLLDELAQRAERHLVRLQRIEVRKQVREPFRTLRRNWPSDWAIPVPDAAYMALAECHVSDPRGQIHDWAELKDQLDAHQAQYHLRQVLAELPGDRISWAEIETVLVDALSLNPDLWTMAAPLFGLLDSHGATRPSEARPEIRAALESAATRLLGALPGGAQDDSANSPRSLFHHANALLARAFRRLHRDARRFVHLWGCLEKTLSPVLVDGTEALIAEVEAMAATCLEHWPAGGKKIPRRNDPRNPVRFFLESCARSKCLAEAERWLNDASPAPEKAKKCLARAFDLGLEMPDQWRRAATCLYLVEYGQEDTLQMQRQVLDRLDVWVDGIETDGAEQVGDKTITEALVVLRADARVDQPMPAVETPVPSEPEHPSDDSSGPARTVEPPEV